MENLLKLLDSDESENRFAYIKNFAFTMPAFKAKGLNETICFPISQDQAKKLISVAKQAPYGKGALTSINTEVRNGWQIDKENIVFQDDTWSQQIEHILRDAEDFFNFEKMSFEAELYKLLIYEKDGFFLPHQDTEKIEDMLATLVICLPSHHSGGLLRISHLDDVVFFDSENLTKNDELACVVFFADCWHELTKITSGNRICLTYNVRVKKNANFTSNDYIHQAEINEALMQIRLENKNKLNLGDLSILLNHQYSLANFCYLNLKRDDRIKFDIIQKAAISANYKIYLGLLQHMEFGRAGLIHPYGKDGLHIDSEGCDYIENNKFGEPLLDYRQYFEHQNGWALEYYDNNEIDFKNEVEFCESDDIDNKLLAIKDTKGLTILKGRCHFDIEKLLNSKDYHKHKFYYGRYTPYTGNEGNCFSLSYQFATILLLPPENEFEILLSYNVDAAIRKLQRELTIDDIKDNYSLSDRIDAIFQVLENNEISRHSNYYGIESGAFSSLFDLLCHTKKYHLLQRLIKIQYFLEGFKFTPERVLLIEKFIKPEDFFALLVNLKNMPCSNRFKVNTEFIRFLNIVSYCTVVGDNVYKALIESFLSVKHFCTKDEIERLQEVLISKKADAFLKYL